MDVGKLITLAVSLAVIGGLMASTIFSNFTATRAGGTENYTGIMAIIR